MRTQFLSLAYQQAGLNLQDSQVQLLSDQKIVEASFSGRVKFAAPGGAPQVVQLEVSNWKPILTPLDITANTPPDPNSPAVLLTNNVGGFTRTKYLDENFDTLVRLTSVMYRIIDAIQKSPNDVLPDQLPYINSVAGTKLDVKSLQIILSAQDPIINFEDAARFITKTDSPVYYKTVYTGQIGQLKKSGVLKSDRTYDEEDVFAAVPKIYQALVDHKANADKALAQLKGQSLSPERQKLVDQANDFYSWRDYLDADRFATAALG